MLTILKQICSSVLLLPILLPLISTTTLADTQATITEARTSEPQTAAMHTPLPDELLESIQVLSEAKTEPDNDLDYELALSIAIHAQALHDKLAPIIEADQHQEEDDKAYILATSFTSFMYIMLSIADYAIANEIEAVNFKPIKQLIHLLVTHGLVTDHSSLEKMLSTLDRLAITEKGYKREITFFTTTGKTIEEDFDDGIPSPRFVISSVIFKNKAKFTLSHLFHPQNQEKLARFRKDSQKHFLTGGLVLMDKQQENILDYLNSFDYKASIKNNEPCPPLLIEGQGFSGRGYIKGFKLPSPAAKLESIYLIPGRQGTPAFIRARSLMMRPFVAL